MAKRDATENSSQLLDALLKEATALAHRFRQLTAGRVHAEDLHTGARSVVQLLVQNGACSVPQIGRIRSTSRQSVQVIVNHLLRNGCVELLRNPAHQRSPLIRVTEKGKAALLASIGSQEQPFGPALFEVPAPELLSALSVLKRVRQGLAETADGQKSGPTRLARVRQSLGRSRTLPAIAATVAPTGVPEPEYDFPVNLL